MKLLANRRIRITHGVVTFVTRKLEGKGQILVQVGQEVQPGDLLGRSLFSGGFRNIKVAPELGVSFQEAKKYLKKQIGQTIYQGEPLAYKRGGLFNPQKIVFSPVDGILDYYDEKSGVLRIRYLPRKVNLPAAVFGVVELVDQQRGEVLIKTMVTQIFGLFGSGKARDGNLAILGGRGSILDGKRLTSILADHIVVGGSNISADGLKKALELGVSGLVTGGIEAKDYKAISGGRIIFPPRMGSDVGISVVVCEGFGTIPQGADIFDELEKHNGKFAFINGQRASLSLPIFDKDCMIKIRGTQFPHFQQGYLKSLMESKKEPEVVEIELGQKVRILSSPFLGVQGQIIAVDQRPTVLESKLATILLTLQLPTRKVKIPYSNIEVI